MELPRILLAAAVVVALVGASVLPLGKLPGDPGNYLGHFSAYGLAMVALAGVARLRPWAVAVGLVGLGVGIEFVQPFFYRANHWQDMVANGIGVGIGWLTLIFWSGSQRGSESD